MKKPIVMIVDDEPEFGLRLKKSFAVAAAWGCLFIDDLSEALSIVQSGRYDVKILLTDWHFARGTNADMMLFDGVDLIERVQEVDKGIECFLMTAQQSSTNFDARASKIEKVRVMFKQNFDLGSTARVRDSFAKEDQLEQQPWTVIASNVVYLSGSPHQEELSMAVDSVFETYIQEMPKGLLVTKPIPITVSAEHDEGGGYFKASAPRLGLLIEGYGDDPVEAIEELKEVIRSHYYKLGEGENLEGLAALSYDLMNQHLSIDAKNREQLFRYG